MLLYAMVTGGNVPFLAPNIDELKGVVNRGDFEFPAENPKDSKTYSDTIVELISKMLKVDVEKRITISDILAHPWLCQDGL